MLKCIIYIRRIHVKMYYIYEEYMTKYIIYIRRMYDKMYFIYIQRMILKLYRYQKEKKEKKKRIAQEHSLIINTYYSFQSTVLLFD